jgi:hypothetical protein
VTAPAEALTDPVGTVICLVTAADPALGHDLVRRIVGQVGGGRSKRRRLAVELAGNPAVLTTGRSPASKVAGELMLALRAAGATGISPPWCADCGRRVTSMQRRGEHWYCAPCYVRPEDCAGCGNTRQVAFRDRQGRPRCSKCPDQDARDPLLALVEVIVMTDPGLPRARAVPCTKCGTTRESAARDGQGRPLCPYCLVSDPVNLEDCVRCHRRRQVSTPHARRAGLRDLQPARHPDLRQLRTHRRSLHGLQGHLPATVRSMRPVTGTVLTVRAARPGPRRHA